MKKLASLVMALAFSASAFAQNLNTNGAQPTPLGNTNSTSRHSLQLNLSGVVQDPDFIAANFPGTANTVYLSPNGNDTTAIVGNPNLAASSFAKAKSLAFPISGTIVVGPGTYTDHNILTNGVNYYFMPGAVVSYYQSTTNDDGYGIIDDRSCGATTNIIAGKGVFNFLTYTGFVQGPTFVFNTNFYGVIVLKNSNTVLHCEGDTISGSIFQFGALGDCGLIDVIDCNEAYFKFNLLTDPNRFPSNSFSGWPFWNRVSNSNVIAKANATIGVVWHTGNVYCDIEKNDTAGSYGIWGFTDSTYAPALTKTADFWYYGKYLSHKIYMDNLSQSNSWRSWIYVNEIEWSGLNGFGAQNGADFYGNGKHYLTAQKINPGADNGIGVNSGAGDKIQVWANVQKISASNNWVNVNGPGSTLFADVMQFEDTGAVGFGQTALDGVTRGGIVVTGNGNANIRFLSATITNSVASNVVAVANSKLVISGGYINSTSSPVAYPVSVFTNGNVILKGVTLVASNGLYAINATNAVNVGTFYTTSATTNALLVTPYPASGFITNSLIQ